MGKKDDNDLSTWVDRKTNALEAFFKAFYEDHRKNLSPLTDEENKEFESLPKNRDKRDGDDTRPLTDEEIKELEALLKNLGARIERLSQLFIVVEEAIKVGAMSEAWCRFLYLDK